MCSSDLTVAERPIELSEEQIAALERFSPEFRERHIEADFAGDLVGVDTFFVGHMKGVGKVYMQSAVDCASRYGWGRLYTNKMPITAVQLLHNDVLPTFEAHGTPVKTVLSDNGREFCGRPDKHPYELFLQLEGIEHRKTRVKRPQSNGIVECLHRPRCLPRHLQHRASAPGPRHDRPHALQSVHRPHSRQRQLNGGHRHRNHRY